MVLGAEHAQSLHLARDDSAREILLLSHRLGAAAKPVLRHWLAAKDDEEYYVYAIPL